MFNANTESGVFAPAYYIDFKCIADKCKHSCCIDWEICIDSEALEKYKNIESIVKTVTASEDGVCFALTEDAKCPHLNNSGLCNIIIKHGEDYLCEICRNHPRFFNNINNHRIEAGLGIVCEEACRLVLENEKPFSLVCVEEIKEGLKAASNFDPIVYRNQIISMIEKPDRSFDEKLTNIQDEFKIFEIYTHEEWIERFLSLEILDDEWEQMLKALKGKPLRQADSTYGKHFARLLTYFVYRHVSVAESYDDLRAKLAFSILSVKMIRRIFEESKQSPENLIDISRRYSAEIEYCEDNTYELIFTFERNLKAHGKKI